MPLADKVQREPYQVNSSKLGDKSVVDHRLRVSLKYFN